MLSEIVVAKFGGSSLADSNQFKKVKDIVFSNKKRKYIVPSAPGKRYKGDEKITDLLFQCYNSIENKEKFIETFKIIEDRYIDTLNNDEIIRFALANPNELTIENHIFVARKLN